jgi:hypothetical protein
MVDRKFLLGIYMTRIVATLELYDRQSSFTDARGYEPLAGKSPLVVPLPINGVAKSDGNKTGKGENLSEMSEGELLSSATALGSGLQRMCSSLPVEERFDNQFDTSLYCKNRTEWQNTWEETGQISKTELQGTRQNRYNVKGKQKTERLVGFVTIQIANMSLEEVELYKHTYIGDASPTKRYEID